MSTALNSAKLHSSSSPSSSSSSSSSSFNDAKGNDDQNVTSSSTAVHSDSESTQCPSATADTGSGDEIAASLSPVEAPSGASNVVDDFLPSCDDVIQQFLQFQYGETLLTTSKSIQIGEEAEFGRQTSMVASTSSATTTMPTGLSMSCHQRSTMNGMTSPAAQGLALGQQQQNATHATETGGTSTNEARLPVGGPVMSSAAAGEMPIVYLLASPGVRPGLNVSVQSSGVGPPSVGGATFAVVSQANSSANGDVRPVLRFLQISKPPPGGVLPGPVAPFGAGIHLVGARPAPAGRMTPVFAPFISQSVMRPSSQASAVMVPTMTSALPTQIPVNNHVVHHGGGPAGLVRLASLPPHHQLNPSSTGAVFLVASGANSAVDPRASGVNRHLFTSPSTFIGACSSGSFVAVSSSASSATLSMPRPAKSLPQAPSFASLVASSAAAAAAAAALAGGEPPTTVTGSRQNVHEKNAYEYERVMDILRYYRELVVERKLPGACLPCKRRKSKPLVSAAPGATPSSNDDDCSPLPIPPPPPPPALPLTANTSGPSTRTALSQPCSVFGGMLLPGMPPGIRIPFVRALATTPAPAGNFVNGVRPFGLPLNVAALFPPGLVVSTSPQVVSTSAAALTPHQLPSEESVRRLLFYAAAAAPSVGSPPSIFVSTTSVSGSSDQTVKTTSSAFSNDDLTMSFVPPRSHGSMTSPLHDAETVLQDVNWKSDWSKLSSLASLTSSAFEIEPPVAMSRPKSADVAPIADERLPPSCRSRSRSLSGIESRSKCVSGPNSTTNIASTAGHRAEAVQTGDTFLDPPLLMTSSCGNNSRFTSSRDYNTSDAYPTVSSDDRLAETVDAPNGCSPSLIMWPTTASHPVGLDPLATGNECNGDAFAAARIARKRHLTDDDDSTWPEMGNSDDDGRAPHDLLNELEATYPDTRAPIAAVKETGCTLTTVTFVTKWTSSRLAVVGPYQSWN